MKFKLCAIALTACVGALDEARAADSADRIRVLMLGGSRGSHQSERMSRLLIAGLDKSDIAIEYTEKTGLFQSSGLSPFDVLLIYKDNVAFTPAEESALFEFIEGGKGLVAVHCASACDLASARYAGLIGGRFQRHGVGSFRAKIIDAGHPSMQKVASFATTDETYVHDGFADDLRVLMVRDDDGRFEPYSWVRRQGNGRVFYTALGHDERTWKRSEFHALLAQAIRWAAGRVRDPHETKPFQRLPADLPNYVAKAKWGTEASRHTSMQGPVAPEESMRHMTVPEGFRVELFAAEPEIVKPIALSWDAGGRAWIAESIDYPNDKQPDGQGHDRIRICDDTNGDGKADRFTIFADKLSVPTSLVHAAGGVIVSQAPHMLFLADTDGDDRADVRKVLFSGFGTYDTHAGPSNLRLGLDNWIWATVGYAGFDGTVGGKTHRFRQGVFRFRPDGSELEFVTPTSNNTWGLGIDELGNVFYSTANNEHSSHVSIPNRYYEAVRGWHGVGNARMADHSRFHPISFVRQMDWHGGFTAAAGHAVYTARQFPAEYWNKMAFVCEPTGHLVHVVRIQPQAAGFRARDGYNLFASMDEWAAPIVADVGPDGAVWIIDWYNYVVQHNPTPIGFKTGKGNAYVTPLRDRTHGRIYRLLHSARPLPSPRDLRRATAEQLVEALSSDNLFWRLTAQRLLVDRGSADAIAPLVRLTDRRERDEIGNTPAALHALWTLHGLSASPQVAGSAKSSAAGAELGAVCRRVLTHPAAAVRRAAVELLPRTAESVAALLESNLLTDSDARVRIAALLALSEMPPSENAGKAVAEYPRRADLGGDRWQTAALTAAAARHDRYFLEAALVGAAPEATAPITRVVKTVAEHWARSDPPGDAVIALLRLQRRDVGPQLGVVLEGMADGWPRGRNVELDAATADQIGALADGLDDRGKLQLARLLDRWGAASRVGRLADTMKARFLADAENASRPDSARIEAARQLVQLAPDVATIEKLLDLIGPRASPTLAAALLDAVGQASDSSVSEALVARWRSFTPAGRRVAIPVLLRRPEWTLTLLNAIEAGKVSAADLDFEQAQRLLGHRDQAIARRARKLMADQGRLPNADRQKVLHELLRLTEITGDPTRGREVFRENCSKCHRHGSLGETIGPDLTGFVVHPKTKILGEVIDPNQSVEANFRQYTVATADGRVLAGMLAAESRTAIELVDSEAKRHVVLREDIEELVASQKSLMPEGFEKLKQQDLVDLLEFLTQRGKYVPLPLAKAATIASTRGMFYSAEADVERLIFADWGPKTFGDVPFQLVDPRGGSTPNVILLHGPIGEVCRNMPASAIVPCHTPAAAIHLLSGVSGWGFPFSPKGSVSVIVRLHYADGATEDHPLVNGEHFADYIRPVEVPGSKLAFRLRGQQIRYLAVTPKRTAAIESIEFVKGPDQTAPVVMAVTAELP